MGAYSRTYSLTDGTTAYGSQVAFELDALGTSVNNVTNAQIVAGAGIVDTKLAQITTASKVSGAAITLLTSVPSGAGVLPRANIADGHVEQVVNVTDGAVATGTTLMVSDDSIPQNTEGDEYMTLAITPKATTNKLKIEVSANFNTTTNAALVTALFQDSTANALSAALTTKDVSDSQQVTFTHYMDAGTTSATTFKVRAGGVATHTTTFNGVTSAARMGGTMASSITITEIKAS